MKLLIIIFTLIVFTAAPLHAANSARHIEINGEITWDTYNEVIEDIVEAPAGGVLFVYIDSPGGNADAGDEIAYKLKKCKSNVVTVINGTIASAAFNILIAGDYVYVIKCEVILIHAAYVDISGVTLHVFPGLKELHEKQKRDYRGYLTRAEEKFIFEEYGDLLLSKEVFLKRVDNDTTHLKRLNHLRSEVLGINKRR